MRTNRLKERLARGEVARGVSVMIPSPQVVEMLARLGFDWVLLDCEHGTISVESLELMTMAAEANGITTLARPRGSSAEALLEVLERGVHGVQVPHVNTAEQARGVVEAVKYHPAGRRGLAARTRPAGYGLGQSLEAYTSSSNRETLICIQVEQREAMENLSELLQVQHVDVLFLGPSDLSQSLGHPGRPDHPSVREAMSAAFARIRDAGRIAGCAGNAAQWREYEAQGVTYLYTHLPALLAQGAHEYLEPTPPAVSPATPPLPSHPVR